MSTEAQQNQIEMQQVLPEVGVFDMDLFSDVLPTTDVDRAIETKDEVEKNEELPVVEANKDKEQQQPSAVNDEETVIAKEKQEEDTTDTKALHAHFEILKTHNLLKLPEDFEFNGNNLEEAYQQDAQLRQQEAANNIVNGLMQQNPKAAKLIEYVLNGGSDMEGYFNNVVSKFSFDKEPDFTDETEGKRFIEKSLKSKGIRDGQIKYIIEGYEDEGKITEEAKLLWDEAKEEYQKQEAEALLKEQQQKEKNIQNAQKYREDFMTELGNTGWADRKKQEIITLLANDSSTGISPVLSKINQIFENPKYAIQLADIVSGFDPQKGWDLGHIKAEAQTKATDELKRSIDQIAQGAHIPRGTVTSSEEQNSILFDPDRFTEIRAV